MKDKHNVILILVSSSELNSFFSGVVHHITFSVRDALSFLFPEFQALIITKLNLKSLQGFTLCFKLLFLLVTLCYRSSSWRFYMIVHQGLNPFSKRSSRLFSEEFKLSSSCNPECNSFYCIIRGGILSFLIIWVHVS